MPNPRSAYELPYPTDGLVDAVRKDSPSILPHVWLFIRHFLKDPVRQGSIVPSSRFLVNGVMEQVDWQKARTIVEFGPGVGTLTHEILRRMRSDAVLIAFELNQKFVTLLQNEVSDTRLRIVHASAADICRVLTSLNLGKADYVISSLPYTNMGDAARREIMHETRMALVPTGTLLVFQYTTTILPLLHASFSCVRQKFELLNIPPARIFNCTL